MIFILKYILLSNLNSALFYLARFVFNFVTKAFNSLVAFKTPRDIVEGEPWLLNRMRFVILHISDGYPSI